MIIKTVALKDIVSFLGKKVLDVYGEIGEIAIDNITNVDRVNENSLDWINPERLDRQRMAEKSRAKTILVDKSLEYSAIIKNQGKILIVVDNPKLALMSVIKQFFAEKPRSGIDKSAFVHPEAIIGDNVYIGPHCFIGKCKIGDNNIIHSNVTIYDRTTIGSGNEIHSGALICVDGLGCERLPDGSLEEFPQIGGVIIGNNCYIGGNTHIASGSLSDTIIGNGCKINGMSFIGSNDLLHDNVWITGSTMLAGSVEVGENTTIYSRVVIRDWVNVGANVIIGMGSVVINNVPDNEVWVGTPAHKIKNNE